LDKKLPSPLEFFAYVYFFLGFLAGPAFNYKEYSSFVDGTLFFSKMPLKGNFLVDLELL